MAPRLDATVENGDLSIVVKDSDGEIRDSITTDAAILTQNQQFVTSFERPILTLLTLYQREQAEVAENGEGFENDEIEPLQTE
jgi:hypothetical protein